MRKLVIIILVLAAVGAGLYSAAWFVQSGAAKQQVENAVSSLNAKQPYVSYESISVTGFPSDVVIKLTKPKFSGRVDMLLRELAQQGAPGGLSPADQRSLDKMPEWQEDSILDGDLTIGINLFSDHYTLVSNGSWHSKSTIGGMTESVSTQPGGPINCDLKMQRTQGLSHALWNMSLSRNFQQFAQDFRGIDCGFPVSTLIDDESKAPLMSSGGMRLFITSAPTPGQNQLRFYVNAINMEVTEAGDKWFDMYMRVMEPGYPFSNRFSLYGKQNAEIDFIYNGPADMKPAATPTFDVHLVKLAVTNNVYNLKGEFQMAISENAGQQGLKLFLNAESNYGEQYDALVHEIVRGAITEMATSDEPQFASFKPFFKTHTPDETFAIVSPAIPNFHSLGKVIQAVDLTAQGNPGNHTGDANLARLELSTSQYGITGNGSAKMAQGQMTPAGSLHLTCANCFLLIDDVAAYVGRVQKAVTTLAPEGPAMPSLEPQQVEGFKQFLQALSEPAKDAADKTTFNYTIVSDGKMGITISGKPINEVMALQAQYMGNSSK